MTDEKSEHPVVFGGAFEGLARAWGPSLTPSLIARLDTLGVNLKKVQAAYPLPVWLETLDLAAHALSTEATAEARYRVVGRLFVRGFIQTGVGLAAVGFGKVLGPKRMLQRMGRNFRTGTNYLDSDFIDEGPKVVRIGTFVSNRFRPHMGPGSMAYGMYRQGILEEAVVSMGVKGTVELVNANVETQDFSYRISWQ